MPIFDFNAAGADTEDPEIEAMVSLREDARERKDYEEADRIREDLRRRNVVIEDTAVRHRLLDRTNRNSAVEHQRATG